MAGKRSFGTRVPVEYRDDEFLMERALSMGCWRCGGSVKRIGERKVVCVMCGCELEWTPTVDGS